MTAAARAALAVPMLVARDVIDEGVELATRDDAVAFPHPAVQQLIEAVDAHAERRRHGEHGVVATVRREVESTTARAHRFVAAAACVSPNRDCISSDVAAAIAAVACP